MINKLQKIMDKKEKLAVGLMSGTSADGIDTALVRIEGSGFDTSVELIRFDTYEFSDKLRDKILENSNVETARLDDICRLNFLLGEAFANSVLTLLKDAKISPEDVDFIGSHGQTIHHLPEEVDYFNFSIKSTLQIGEPSVIAKRTGILTVADFRPADMAMGGEGAPLIPYVDSLLFQSEEKCRVCLNIGGIANLTFLPPPDADAQIIAFDTGPGNMIIDQLVNRVSGGKKRFDEGGETASAGEVNEDLLKRMMEHPFLLESPPKSTGRETFGSEYLDWIMESGRSMKFNDLIATVTAFTVQSISGAITNFLIPEYPIDEIIISGGGVKNKMLISGLKQEFTSLSVKASDDYGVHHDAKEAIGFALLANETLMGNPSNFPSVTGAKKPVVLGKMVPPL